MASNSFLTGSGSSDHQKRSNQQTGASCRKKPSKSSSEINKKKTPRRGMGVEKLERLISNNNNKITATSCSPSLPPYAFIPTTAFAGNGPLPAMMSFSRYGGMGAVGGGSLIPQQLMGGITGAFFPNGQGVRPDHVKGNSNFELPSIPNLMQCDFGADCSKKKRHVRYACNKMGMVCDGVNPSFGDTPQGTAKVVAIHRRKAASTTMGRENDKVVKEYDFLFPEGIMKSSAAKTKSHDDELLMMMKLGGGTAMAATTVVVQGGEASCLTTTTAADDASTCIDLSLKLSN